MPFKMLGTGLLLRQALQNSWHKPAFGTCPLKCLGHARSWDKPFKTFEARPLLGQALHSLGFVVVVRLKLALGTKSLSVEWRRRIQQHRFWIAKEKIVYVDIFFVKFA